MTWHISVYDEVHLQEDVALRAVLATLTLPDPESDMNYQLGRFTRQRSSDYLYAPWMRAAVARSGEEVVGWSVLYVARREPRFYVDVFVREDRRRQGLGVSLIKRGALEARAHYKEQYGQTSTACLVMSDDPIFRRAFAGVELLAVAGPARKLLVTRL